MKYHQKQKKGGGRGGERQGVVVGGCGDKCRYDQCRPSLPLMMFLMILLK